MDTENTDFKKLREAILTYEDCPHSPVAKETFNHWRHFCFTNYPVGEVMKVITDTYQDIGDNAKSNFSKFPRRWITPQHS